jgi:hypothetical protein
MKLDFSSELKSFIEDVSKFGVVSVTTKHCSTSLVKKVAFQAQIPQGNDVYKYDFMFVPHCNSYIVFFYV